MEIVTTILKDTYSLSQLRHRLNVLRAYFLTKFFGSTVSESLSKKDSSWLESLPPIFYEQFNKDNVYQIFAAIEKEVNKLPVLTIYLAFEADDTSLQQIGNFVRTTLNLCLLLDPKLDPKLIAGAALSWKGVYKDYSLRARIEERKTEILRDLKKYLR